MTRVALLWHMHQPFYQDLVTGAHALPWVRLHALKDYWGMVALLRDYPDMRATFNLVPSLLVQIEALSREEGADRHLELGLKPAESLTDDERVFCIEQFFHAHRPLMIDPYPRYRELFAQRAATASGASPRSLAAAFSVDDLRDLQVWHKLVWVDPEYQAHDARVRALLAKGRGFSEADKAVLRDVERELLQRVIPEYAAAAARGQVELSTSPFYHAILPLLCDTDVYLRTHPQSRMPRAPFRRPADAAEQLTRAVALHERLFGIRPRGLWPSEGAVSDAMVPIAVEAGFQWIATDEDILARTCGLSFTRGPGGEVDRPEALYRPYLVGCEPQRIACGFRDHTLSDLIGFRYASWSAEGAAGDLVSRILSAGRLYEARTGGGEATVFIILDGENAWEHYDGQGRPFLRALYAGLTSHPGIRTVTMSEACAAPEEALPSIFPGSWINGDFYVWIGHADDQRAWSQLAEARGALDAAEGSAPAAALTRAREALLIAEGSDWFWWYGDDRSSAQDRAFDELFRRHLRNVYLALGRPVPEALCVTNISTAPPPVEVEPPTALIRPRIDGEETSYFEWMGAGDVVVASAGGAMHQADGRATAVSRLAFGVDFDHLYVRIDGREPMRAQVNAGVEIRVTFLQPSGVRVVSRGGLSVDEVRLERRLANGHWHVQAGAELRAAVGEIAEFRIPFRDLRVGPGATLAFLVTSVQGDVEVEQYPRHGPIEVVVPALGTHPGPWRV